MVKKIALGLLCGHTLPLVLPNLFLQFIIVSCCIVLVIHKKYLQSVVISMALGVILIQSHIYYRATKAWPISWQQPIVIEGVVYDLPKVINDKKYSFNFKINKVILKDKLEHNYHGLVRLNWLNPKLQILPGQSFRFLAKLKRVRDYANPGSPQLEKVYFYQNIVATGYVKDICAQLNNYYNFTILINLVRKKIADNITTILQHHCALGPILAITIGIKDYITKNDWQLFQRTGTSHLMAISGLHIAVVAASVAVIVKIFSKKPVILAIAAIVAAFVYAILAGFGIATKRALWMIIAYSLATLLRKKISAIDRLSYALVAVLLTDPFASLSPGFWLSFFAVFFLLWGLNYRLAKPKWYQAQIVAFIGLLPVSLLYFPGISFISPIANSIAIPIMSLIIVPLSLFSVSITSAYLLKFSANLLELLLSMLSFLNKLSVYIPSYIEVSSIPIWLKLALILMALLLILPAKFPGRLLFCLSFSVLFIKNFNSKIAYGAATLTILDVGQGLASIVRTAQHVLIYDTGEPFAGENIIWPYLKFNNINYIDLLLISHADNDHLGGAKYLLKEHYNKIDKKLISEPYNNFDALCKAGQHWSWDGVLFEVLAPLSVETKRNNLSCVLKVTPQVGYSYLLTGDIESVVEQKLVNYYGSKLQSEVLLAPHHGSNSSSSANFLQAVNPKLGIFSAGYLNRYKHPHIKVLQRYNKMHIDLLSTVNCGAITIIGSNYSCYKDSYLYRSAHNMLKYSQ